MSRTDLAEPGARTPRTSIAAKHLVALALAAIAATAHAEPLPVKRPLEPAITISRGGCFGTCPAYRLTVFENGDYFWEGWDHVARQGVHRGEMGKEVFLRALSVLKASHYERFHEKYTYGYPKDCRNHVTDQETVTIIVQLAGRPKTITHYRGCLGFEGEFELSELEDRLDHAMQSRRWIGEPAAR